MHAALVQDKENYARWLPIRYVQLQKKPIPGTASGIEAAQAMLTVSKDILLFYIYITKFMLYVCSALLCSVLTGAAVEEDAKGHVLEPGLLEVLFASELGVRLCQGRRGPEDRFIQARLPLRNCRLRDMAGRQGQLRGDRQQAPRKL